MNIKEIMSDSKILSQNGTFECNDAISYLCTILEGEGVISIRSYHMSLEFEIDDHWFVSYWSPAYPTYLVFDTGFFPVDTSRYVPVSFATGSEEIKKLIGDLRKSIDIRNRKCK